MYIYSYIYIYIYVYTYTHIQAARVVAQDDARGVGQPRAPGRRRARRKRALLVHGRARLGRLRRLLGRHVRQAGQLQDHRPRVPQREQRARDRALDDDAPLPPARRRVRRLPVHVQALLPEPQPPRLRRARRGRGRALFVLAPRARGHVRRQLCARRRLRRALPRAAAHAAARQLQGRGRAHRHAVGRGGARRAHDAAHGVRAADGARRRLEPVGASPRPPDVPQHARLERQRALQL